MWVVSASDPQLPLQIEDAGRRVTDDEEGNFAKVRLFFRATDSFQEFQNPQEARAMMILTNGPTQGNDSAR